MNASAPTHPLEGRPQLTAQRGVLASQAHERNDLPAIGHLQLMSSVAAAPADAS